MKYLPPCPPVTFFCLETKESNKEKFKNSVPHNSSSLLAAARLTVVRHRLFDTEFNVSSYELIRFRQGETVFYKNIIPKMPEATINKTGFIFLNEASRQAPKMATLIQSGKFEGVISRKAAAPIMPMIIGLSPSIT